MVRIRPDGWKPWANTIAYYPFEKDINDYSWNWNNWTSWWWTYSWWFLTTTSLVRRSKLPNYDMSWEFTYSVWVDMNNTASDVYIEICTDNNYYPTSAIRLHSKITVQFHRSNTWYVVDSPSSYTWIHCIQMVRDSSKIYLYIDWTLIWSSSCSSWAPSNNYYMQLWNAWSSFAKVRLSNLIIEKKARTAEEITSYYNLTKSNYWL